MRVQSRINGRQIPDPIGGRHSLWQGYHQTSLACGLLLATLAGCGTSGPRVVPVKGTVYFRAEPVTNGEITFAPVGGKGQSAQAQINPDGSFTARLNDSQPGLMEGEYKVIIIGFKVRPDQVPPAELAKLGDTNLAVPKKYTAENTTDLTVSITSQDRSKDLEFELAD